MCKWNIKTVYEFILLFDYSFFIHIFFLFLVTLTSLVQHLLNHNCLVSPVYALWMHELTRHLKLQIGWSQLSLVCVIYVLFNVRGKVRGRVWQQQRISDLLEYSWSRTILGVLGCELGKCVVHKISCRIALLVFIEIFELESEVGDGVVVLIDWVWLRVCYSSDGLVVNLTGLLIRNFMVSGRI